MNQSLSTHGIGASEIAAICGLSPYESAWGVWLRKTGQAPDVDPTPQIEWGHRLEPAIRQKYADATGATMYVPPESMFHPETKWARATPDAIVVTESFHGSTRPWPREFWSHLVQVKNVGYWPGKDWLNGPPVYVQLQEAWEMYVTGLDRADVAALIGGGDYRTYTVHRDDRMITDLVDIAAAFWRRVESRTPPPVDESEACRDHFSRCLAKVPHVELVADEEAEALVEQWRRARAEQKAVEKRVETLRNKVRALMDEAQCDRIIARCGSPSLSRTAPKTYNETNWRLVAELLGTSEPNRFHQLVEANTVTTTTEPSVTLREPREWGKENR